MWWYYRGSVTTPVDIDGKPTVLRPRMKFEAPSVAVAHLVRIGQVVPCKAPKVVAPPPPKSPPDVAPVVKGDAPVVAAVVESVGAEPSAEVSEVEEPKAELEEAPRVEEKPVEEKVKAKKSRWKDRDLG